MKKKGNLYYPGKELKKQAWADKEKIYKEAKKDPLKFWEKLAKEINWVKKPKKTFVHKPPYFEWFKGGKLNITQNALDDNLEERKNKVALIWEPEPPEERPRVFTYYDLYREVNKFANALKKLGVKKGDKVGIYLPMIPEVVIAMMGCARIGAVHSVVFSAFSAKALQIRLQDTQAKVLVTADGYYRRGKVIDLKKKAMTGIKDTKVKKVIVVKRAGNKVAWKKGRDLWWHELVEGEKDECKPVAMKSEDTLFILYTSGSTGKPKGCIHVCGGYTVQAYWTGKYIFDFKDHDIFWSTADVGWITGHTYTVYSPLLNGATVLIFEGAPNWPKPDRWAETIEKYGVTIFYTAPTAIRMFQKEKKDVAKDHDFGTLRILGSVGEPIDEPSWKWYYNEVGRKSCPVLDTWWQTETGGILITSLPGIGPFKPTFAGRPFPGIQFEIVDEEGKEVPVNEEGNLIIRPPFNPGLLRGVYKNPKKYKKTYWSEYGEEIYFTEDKAFKDKNGLIRILGRADDVMKVAGHRICTGELENIISKHERVAECAVVGMPHEIKGEVPVVFVVPNKKVKKGQLEKEIVKKVRDEIGPIALPQQVYLVGDLPKTRSGKIMRRILRRLFTGEALGDLSTLSNPTSVEQVKSKIRKK
ncbi:MAG: acetate--CoA ligase [Candidatus Nealsonbacteria bacterium]|nr:acetate--CoA ligase [Candidatus Nealsonbacteria bacterium]